MVYNILKHDIVSESLNYFVIHENRSHDHNFLYEHIF